MRSYSLRTQITAAVFGLSLAATVALGLLAYRASRGSIERSALEAVQATARERESALRARLQARRARMAAFLATTRRICGDPGRRAECRRTLETFSAVEGSAALLLRVPGGDTLATGAGAEVLGTRLPDPREPLARFGFHSSGKPFYLIRAVDEQSGIRLAARFDDLAWVNELFAQRAGLGESGESFLADQRGVAITPLRHPERQGQNDPISAAPMRRCLTEQGSHAMLAPDYRPERVLHALRYVDFIGGGCIMAHVQADEAFLPAHRLGMQILGFGLALLGAAVVVSMLLARAVARPIARLAEAATQLREGNVEVAIPRTGPLEIRHFADTFADMAASIRARRVELEHRAAELERSNRELDQFAYIAAHDLKTPLRGMASLATWIGEDLADTATPEVREYLRLLDQRARRMQALIDDLLLYARAGRTLGATQRVHVETLVREAAATLEAGTADVTVQGEMPVLYTRPAALARVFTELFENAAVHAAPATGGPAPVRASARKVNGAWEFSVADRGPGIAPEFHDKIFALFQVLEAKRDAGRTGIGLPLVKKIVEANHGRVWVETHSEGGAVFRFTWPEAPLHPTTTASRTDP